MTSRRIAVLGTGGTIASRLDQHGAAQPVDRVGDIVVALGLGEPGGVGEVQVEARDLFVKDSSALTTADQALIVREVLATLGDSEIDGVVVTHGTDTAEETAYLLDLVHTDDRPVVLTGAQRPADAPDADGPRNLRDGLSVAADPRARGLGVLVVFDGVVLAARGARKVHTREAAAFAHPDGGVLGRVVDGKLVLDGIPAHREHLVVDPHDIEALRVDIAAVYPGVDGTALEAFAAAGARGVVLVATGSGNANPAVVAAVADLTRQGIVVGLTTRVDTGPVAGTYGGGGGGADLVAAGAVPLGTLRAGQGRILLLALLAAVGDPERVRALLPAYVN
ncbi:asparaginase [Nocardioides bizhenqiangii]|uniref:asparaginase n=1 Tax=Nocardioides bizhenqiangii TaxID=3095076 RepID=A0ABZ0ZR91_9ACTN|nr:asparaginase [Nocardioides sp. HM61]WQQ26294.1 asparaginase [Nocardioides sp. HM61]